MAASDTDPNAFAEAWLAQQQRFWEGLRAQQGGAGYRHAQAQWTTACEGWWSAVAGSAPESLKPVLDTALDHTRLCLELGVQIAEGKELGAVGHWLLSPERMFQAAATAMGQAPAAGTPAGDAAQVKAMADAMALLSRIARDTLEAVRRRLAAQTPDSPADLLDLYTEELEGHYLAAARSDEFARVAGDLVNAWVAAEAGRRAGRP